MAKSYTEEQVRDIRTACDEKLKRQLEKFETEKSEIIEYYEEKNDKLDKECCQLRRAIVELAKRL